MPPPVFLGLKNTMSLCQNNLYLSRKIWGEIIMQIQYPYDKISGFRGGKISKITFSELVKRVEMKSHQI